MYFTNIANDELSHFHNQTKCNVSIALKDISNGGLFKKETIITDNIYKIYPLFYCDEIHSSNPNDKVLDNKCVICENNDETSLVFTYKNNEPVTSLHCTYKWISSNCVCGCVYDNQLNVLENVTVTLGKTKTSTDGRGLFYIYSNTTGDLKLEYKGLELIL